MTAIQAIDRELERLHKELSSFQEIDQAYYEVLKEVTRVNKLLSLIALKDSGVEIDDETTMFA